jgi:hypothetical protein
MTQHYWATPEWFSALMRSFALVVDEIGDAQEPYSFTAQYVIYDAPGGTIRYVEEIRDRHMAYVGLGEAREPDVVLTIPYADYKTLISEMRSSHELPSLRVTGALEKLAPAIVTRGTAAYRQHKIRTRDFTRWA